MAGLPYLQILPVRFKLAIDFHHNENHFNFPQKHSPERSNHKNNPILIKWIVKWKRVVAGLFQMSR